MPSAPPVGRSVLPRDVGRPASLLSAIGKRQRCAGARDTATACAGRHPEDWWGLRRRHRRGELPEIVGAYRNETAVSAPCSCPHSKYCPGWPKRQRTWRHQLAAGTGPGGPVLKTAGDHDRDRGLGVLLLVRPIVWPGCAEDVLDDPAVAAGQDPRLGTSRAAALRPAHQRPLQIDRNFRQESDPQNVVQLVARKERTSDDIEHRTALRFPCGVGRLESLSGDPGSGGRLRVAVRKLGSGRPPLPRDRRGGPRLEWRGPRRMGTRGPSRARRVDHAAPFRAIRNRGQDHEHVRHDTPIMER